MDKYIGFDIYSKKTVACVVQKGEKDRYTIFKADITWKSGCFPAPERGDFSRKSGIFYSSWEG